MKKIICIKGTKDSGKTTTIGMVYQKLHGKAFLSQLGMETDSFLGYDKCDENCSGCNNRVDDFIAILPYRGYKVGFISAGDPHTNLIVRIKLFITLKVDVIVCCARCGRRNSFNDSVAQKFEELRSILREDKVIVHNTWEYTNGGICTSKAPLVDIILSEIDDALNN